MNKSDAILIARKAAAALGEKVRGLYSAKLIQETRDGIERRIWSVMLNLRFPKYVVSDPAVIIIEVDAMLGKWRRLHYDVTQCVSSDDLERQRKREMKRKGKQSGSKPRRRTT